MPVKKIMISCNLFKWHILLSWVAWTHYLQAKILCFLVLRIFSQDLKKKSNCNTNSLSLKFGLFPRSMSFFCLWRKKKKQLVMYYLANLQTNSKCSNRAWRTNFQDWKPLKSGLVMYSLLSSELKHPTFQLLPVKVTTFHLLECWQ